MLLITYLSILILACLLPLTIKPIIPLIDHKSLHLRKIILLVF